MKNVIFLYTVVYLKSNWNFLIFITQLAFLNDIRTLYTCLKM